MSSRAQILSATIAVLVVAPAAHADVAAVWVTNDGDKLAADDLTTRPVEKSPLFDAGARKISLIAARNETVAFQLQFRGGDADSKQQIRFDGLDGPSRLANAPDAELGGMLGHRIDLFLEHYLKIEQRSRGIGWVEDSFGRPSGYTDTHVPDPLQPIPSGHEFVVPARRNQAIWIDIYVPPDAPPGRYQGPLTAGALTFTVELEVIDATLPPSPTLKTMVWFSGGDADLDVMAARYLKEPDADPAALDTLRKRHFQLARRHRITLFLGQYPEPAPALENELTGKWFTRAEGYEGPGEGMPQDLCVVNAYGDSELTSEQAKIWNDWLDKTVPKIDRINYTVDEPSEEQFAEVNRRAAAGKPLPAFTTSVYEPRLAVDVFATLPQSYKDKDAEAARAAGKRLWLYNGMRPFSGTFLIDDAGVSPRANGWIQFQRGVERWFFWESTYYKNTQGEQGNIDVWKHAANFSNRHDDLANGDGLLFYPGRDRIFQESDKGIDYPVPSIRLKNWRRGLQDGDLLALARAAGHGDFVDSLVSGMLPHSLADKLTNRDTVAYSEAGADWDDARRLILLTLQKKAAQPLPAAVQHEYTPFRQRFITKWAIRGGAVFAFFVLLLIWIRRRGRG